MRIEAVFREFPVLESEEIMLGKMNVANLEDVYAIYSNETVFNYCGIIPKTNKKTVENMIGHFERDYNKGSRIKWGIYLKDEGHKLVGIMEAFDFNSKVDMVTIGYFLAQSHWGRGIASKAAGLAVSFLFNQVQVNRIQAEVMPPNETSKKVLLKQGFVKEGLLRQAALWSGKGVVDLEIYGLLKEEYVAKKRLDNNYRSC